MNVIEKFNKKKQNIKKQKSKLKLGLNFVNKIDNQLLITNTSNGYIKKIK